MAKRNKNYYSSSSDNQNRLLNLSLAMAEKLGIQTPLESSFSVAIPKDVRQGFKQQTANTSNPSRPRAHAIGYNFDSNTLYVVFRDNTWWEYRNCPAVHWENLKAADSTGKYLRESGLDAWPDMGPANLDEEVMSPASKELLSYAAEAAGRLQADTEF